MDPIFKAMQQSLDMLSKQSSIRELMKKRYLRMQEIIAAENEVSDIKDPMEKEGEKKCGSLH